jgi:flagellin-specific chaperone FliS
VIKVIHAQIYSNDFTALDSLAKNFSSCSRFCYKRFLEGNELNAVRKLAKIKYPTINVRQVYDAYQKIHVLPYNLRFLKTIF